MLKACAIKNVSYSDLWETPEELLLSTLPTIVPTKSTIWEPFVGISNRSSKVYKQLGHAVYETTCDFFTIDKWPVNKQGNAMILVSNPPFSRKFEVLDRLFQFKQPFAILLPSWVFASATVRKMIHKHNIDIQIIVPNMRTHYYNTEGQQIRKTAFDSVYIAYGLSLKYPITYI